MLRVLRKSTARTSANSIQSTIVDDDRFSKCGADDACDEKAAARGGEVVMSNSASVLDRFFSKSLMSH